MPIQRPSERRQRPSALDVFTDRENLIAAFERNVARKKPAEHRVLVFYGDGGIGKTTLLQKLEELHSDRFPSAFMGRLDLAGADTTPPDLLLYRLRRQFSAIPFPSFTLALAEYGRRFHPEQVYGSDRKELLQGAGPYADALAGGLEVLGQLSGVGAAVNAMKAAATAQRQLSDWIQRRAEPWLQKSQSLTEEQLLAQLPLQWARDFRQALSSQLDVDWDDAITYSGPPPVIAFDTYENLWHSGMGRSGRRREPREQWLVDLVSELPEVLWVIGGRDRLGWDDAYDREWGDVCEQHLMGQLSREDAKEFLAKRGIHEPGIVEKIVQQAAGVPYYLELEAQLYDKTPPQERTPDVFGGSQQVLIHRLLTHLDPSERATLKLMAAFGIWDRELFQQAVTHFATGYPATGAVELGKFWSIESIGQGRWQLHNEMTHHLQADERQQDPTTFQKVHRWGFAYFDGPLQGLETKEIQAEDAERLHRALRHAHSFQPVSEWVPWLAGRLEELGEGTIWHPLLAVVERGIEEAEHDLGDRDPALAALLNQKSELLRTLARYEEAEPLMRRALAIDEASYGPDHPDVAMDLNNLAQLLMDTNRLAEAEPLMSRVVEIFELSYGKDHSNVAGALSNLAALLLVTNRLDEAELVMARAVEIFELNYGKEHPDVAVALNNLAKLLNDTNRLAEAEPLIRRALAIDEASYGPDHPNVALKLNNLAQLLQATNRLAEAEPLMRRALATDEASYGPDHPKAALRLNNLAGLLQATNRLAEAEPLIRRALAIDEASYGPDHPNVALKLNNLAQLLQATNRLEEAEPLMSRALAIDEASYGPDHPDVAMDLNNLAQLLQATNRLDEAEPLMCRALAIDEASYGPDHPKLAIRLNNMAQLLKATKRLKEAEPLSARAAQIFLATLGDEHPSTQKVKANYINILHDLELSDAETQHKIEALWPLD